MAVAAVGAEMNWQPVSVYPSTLVRRSFRLEVSPRVEIIIHNVTLAYRSVLIDKWVVSCPQVQFDAMRLESTWIDEAKKEAYHKVMERLAALKVSAQELEGSHEMD